MTREHLSPARGQVRTGLGVIALAAALAMGTTACQSTSKSASVVGQDATTSGAAAVGAPSTNASSTAAAAKSSGAAAGDPASASSPAPAAGGGFKIGQQVKVGDFTVTVHKMTYPYSNDIDQPDSGKAYVLLDVEVKNVSGESQAFSSLGQLGLKDSTNTSYDETLVAGADGTPPDGNIAPGESLRGPVAFEVPAGAKGLKFSFQADLISAKTYIDLGK